MTGTAIVGRLRKAFSHLENGAHEAPAPGIIQIAKMPKKAAEGEPAVGQEYLDFRPPAAQACGWVAALSRAGAPAPIPATRLPRKDAKSIGCAACAQTDGGR